MPSSVYEEIRTWILSTTAITSDMLVERTLAQMFGVSRTPIREALQRLEQDGLIERVGQRLRITVRTPEQILEIYDARIVLEASAARGAALRRTELDLVRLQAVHEEMSRLTPEQSGQRRAFNQRFHDCIWMASHNAAVLDVLRRLVMHERREERPTIALPGRWEHILGAHQELIEAIRAQRPEEAERIAAEHMTAARAAFMQEFALEIRRTELATTP